MSTAELRQRTAKPAGPIDVDVTEQSSTAKVDPYDESNLPAFTPHNFTMKEVSHSHLPPVSAQALAGPTETGHLSRPISFEISN